MYVRDLTEPEKSIVAQAAKRLAKLQELRTLCGLPPDPDTRLYRHPIPAGMDGIVLTYAESVEGSDTLVTSDTGWWVIRPDYQKATINLPNRATMGPLPHLGTGQLHRNDDRVDVPLDDVVDLNAELLRVAKLAYFDLGVLLPATYQAIAKAAQP